MGRSLNRKRRYKYVAYHEAGHAVLADYFDLLESVSIDEDPPTTRFLDIDLAVSSTIHYAGILAQSKYQKRGSGGSWIFFGAHDFELINSNSLAVAEALSDSAGSVRAIWKSTARLLLNERWPTVEAVAAALLYRGSLTKRRVRSIVSRNTESVRTR